MSVILVSPLYKYFWNQIKTFALALKNKDLCACLKKSFNRNHKQIDQSQSKLRFYVTQF